MKITSITGNSCVPWTQVLEDFEPICVRLLIPVCNKNNNFSRSWTWFWPLIEFIYSLSRVAQKRKISMLIHFCLAFVLYNISVMFFVSYSNLLFFLIIFKWIYLWHCICLVFLGILSAYMSVMGFEYQKRLDDVEFAYVNN